MPARHLTSRAAFSRSMPASQALLSIRGRLVAAGQFVVWASADEEQATAQEAALRSDSLVLSVSQMSVEAARDGQARTPDV